MSETRVVSRPWVLEQPGRRFALTYEEPPAPEPRRVYIGRERAPLPEGPLSWDELMAWEMDLNRRHGFGVVVSSGPVSGPAVETVPGV